MTGFEWRAELARDARVETAREEFERVTPWPVAGGLPGRAADIARAVDAAVKSAMTVEITPDVTAAFEQAVDTPVDGNDVPAGLRAALEMLGLRVSGS